MKHEDKGSYQTLSDINHFWVDWRFRAFCGFKQLIPPIDTHPSALEMGCGHGLFMWQLQHNLGLLARGCDIDQSSVKKALQLGVQAEEYDILKQRPEYKNAFDVIFLMDVLEHVEDEEQFLRAIANHLKPRGKLFINVPAHAWLFSKYDVTAGHVRRYSMESLHRAVEKCGFRCLESRWWGLSLIPILIARKFLVRNLDITEVYAKGFDPPSRILNTFLTWLGCCETSLIPRPFIGISILAAYELK